MIVSSTPFGIAVVRTVQPIHSVDVAGMLGTMRWIASSVRSLPVTLMRKPFSIGSFCAVARIVTSSMSIRC